tara:strand:+ start:6181 stop:6396 length:216 start_codon:yes stop_codon:yes gene_type:complete
MTDQDGWSTYEKMVLSEITRLSKMQTTTQANLTRFESQLAVLHLKVGLLAGFFGLLGGAIPVAAAIIMKHL